MSEEEIKKIASEAFNENIMNNLDGSIIFKYIQGLEQENKKYKEVIDKLKEYLIDNIPERYDIAEYSVTKIKDILKEVK